MTQSFSSLSHGLSRRRLLGWFGAAGVGVAASGATALAQSAALQGAGVIPGAPPRVPLSGLDAAARADPVGFLDRVGWGANAAQLQALSQLGATAYLDTQLRAQSDPALPPALAAQLAALPANQPLEVLIPPMIRRERAVRQARKDKPQTDAADTEAQLKAINKFKYALTQQAAAQQVLLGLYAQNAVQQRLSWFWLNHFNVFRSGNIGPMMGDYTQRVIGPHALGTFRALLRATMFSPQMLLYLNNAQNARGHVNENYAREVMELHTLGVDGGYTQADVTNLARALTGLGVDLLDKPVRVRPMLRADLWTRGLVVFNPARHDPEPKTVLGHTLQGHGLDEIDDVLTLLAEHPATARHVSTKLAQYFVADHPPPGLVDAMVQRWHATRGEIAAVLRTMFTSPEFGASLRQPQFKDPMRYVLSALRASLGDEPIRNPQPVLYMLTRLGEPLFGRQTPDGYPLNTGAWDSPGQLTARFEVARQIGGSASVWFQDPPEILRQSAPLMAAETGGMDTTPMGPSGAGIRPPRRPPPDLSQSAVYRAQQDRLSVATLRALAQADDRVRWNTLWLSSPDFMNA